MNWTVDLFVNHHRARALDRGAPAHAHQGERIDRSGSMLVRPALQRLSQVVARRPWSAACASATIKTTLADLMVQSCIEKRAELDRKRTATFAIFGCCWMGAGQYFLQCRVIEALLPGRSLMLTAGKVALDQFVHAPFLFFPFFYCVDAAVQGRPIIEHTARRYRAEIVATLQANWCLWLPAMFVAFKLVPTHLRVPYVSAVSFVWTSIMSALQGSFSKQEALSTRESLVHGEEGPLVISAATLNSPDLQQLDVKPLSVGQCDGSCGTALTRDR
tara:strand:- start:1336 stop:2157 length:822 start_codon:yes stop_codon:yes gene_type:complete